jgi:hypothetical protein
MPLGIKPIVDFAFKKIFGSPENVPVLIGLLNAILRLPSPIVQNGTRLSVEGLPFFRPGFGHI